jgi:hypothetical protein
MGRTGSMMIFSLSYNEYENESEIYNFNHTLQAEVGVRMNIKYGRERERK